MPQGIATHIPFPSRISPDAERAQAVFLAWPRAFGLLTSADAEQRHLQGNYPELAARFHPAATGDDLDLGVDQQSWFFLFDDQFDDARGRDPEWVRQLTDPVIDVLTSPRDAAPPDATPLVAAFADLWARSRERMSPSWCARAAQNWRRYLAGHVTEAVNRGQNARPSFASHLLLRQDTCGVPPILDIAERIGHFEVTERAYASPLVTELRLIAAEVVVLDNEIISLEKEEAVGDNNLVLITEHESACSRSAAIERICGLIRERTERFVALECLLPVLCDGIALDRPERAALQRYLTDALLPVMRGAHDWQQHCIRYTPAYMRLTEPGAGPRQVPQTRTVISAAGLLRTHGVGERAGGAELVGDDERLLSAR
jgi:pentalenene synthase